MKYLIGTGYFYEPERKEEADNFSTHTWWENTYKFAEPTRVASICVGGCKFPVPTSNSINLNGNLGHVDDLLDGSKPYKWCGWSAAMLALALIAYSDESDFIYKEQDCLAFGPWVERMYQDCGDAPVIFGSCQIQPAAQSLFLVKHHYIPEFVRLYLSLGPDNIEDNLPEHKFAKLEMEHGWKRFSFGYDRDRPFEVKDEVFYIQQVTAEDLKMLEEAKLI